MGRKDVLINYPMFGLGVSGHLVDISTSRTGSSITVNYLDNIGVVANWAGDSVLSGTILIQGSNDNSVWSTLDFGSSISIAGVSGNHNINMNQFSFSYVRSRYVATTGIGAMTLDMTIKQVGA